MGKFTGKYEHRTFGATVGHNPPQEDPQDFVNAVVDADKLLICAIFNPLPLNQEPAVEHIDHILVVDDDRDIRELIVDYLVKSGYHASGAANGKRCAQCSTNSISTWRCWT